ncbi:MAG: toprim domain-containing protein, partial [Deltaproteobacteria bacterium]|nr:toprim domain-containing protein [Deltaproteobacteria bacterium]
RRLNGIAAAFYSDQLHSPSGAAVRAYLEGRKISESVVGEFGLGFAPDGWQNLRNHLDQMKESLPLAERAGLLASSERGKQYDRFRRRLMFPIRDISGVIVAFGGRIFGEGEPKYLNSPESEIYRKGEILYGLDRTKDEIRKRDCAVLVEGYFDFLSLWTAGITNVAATLGTALTSRHVDVIRRFSRNVILLFDADEGGLGAAERSLKIFLEGTMNARIALLPEGLDPADFVNASGAEAMRDCLGEARSMVDYYIDRVIGDNSFEGTAASLREAVPFVAGIGDVLQRNLFIHRIAERAGLEESVLKQEVARFEEGKSEFRERPPTPSAGMTAERPDKIEVMLLYLMGECSEKISAIDATGVVDLLTNAEARELARLLVSSPRECSFGDRVNDLPQGALRDELLKLIVEEAFDDLAVADRALDDTVQKIRKRWFDRKLNEVQRNLVLAREHADVDRLMEEKQQLLREKQKVL